MHEALVVDLLCLRKMIRSQLKTFTKFHLFSHLFICLNHFIIQFQTHLLNFLCYFLLFSHHYFLLMNFGFINYYLFHLVNLLLTQLHLSLIFKNFSHFLCFFNIFPYNFFKYPLVLN